MIDILSGLSWACLVCAAVPAAVFVWNWKQFRPPALPLAAGGLRRAVPQVSVLIPARNEEAAIGACLAAVLKSRGVELEVVVLDDRSDDATAEVVGQWTVRDQRVRLDMAPPLPAGWCGKQHACWSLALRARHRWLVFLDADVRLAPEALARLIDEAERREIDLLSGFPREETGTWAEKLLIPLIHFILLGFLPLAVSRRRSGAAWAAGCGQIFVTQRAAYNTAGGHASIRQSLHDGVTLPRAYRRAGLRTDVLDLHALARCRMYHCAAEVWQGLGKNATEGLGAPRLIFLCSGLLILGQVLPLPLALGGCLAGLPLVVTGRFAAAALLAYLPRWLAVWKFEQSPLGAMLHPLGVLGFLVIQWVACVRSLLGRPATWKGRAYGDQRPAGRLAGVRPE